MSYHNLPIRGRNDFFVIAEKGQVKVWTVAKGLWTEREDTQRPLDCLSRSMKMKAHTSGYLVDISTKTSVQVLTLRYGRVACRIAFYGVNPWYKYCWSKWRSNVVCGVQPWSRRWRRIGLRMIRIFEEIPPMRCRTLP